MRSSRLPRAWQLLKAVLIAIFFGALLNIAVVWGVAIFHGVPKRGWNPYFNPREGHPVAFFVGRGFGVERVFGFDRPGSLVDREPESVRKYSGSPWWPREAVTFDTGDWAIASGWPFLSLYTWRTTTPYEVDSESIDFDRRHHWGLVLREESRGSERFAMVLPFRPIWRGFIGGMVAYGVIGWSALRLIGMARSRGRRRRGLCPSCAYPMDGLERCPECGNASS